MDKRQSLRSHFKSPEGRYVLRSEKLTGLHPFQSQKGTRLTLASLQGGAEAGDYIVYNVGDAIHISHFNATDKARQEDTEWTA